MGELFSVIRPDEVIAHSAYLLFALSYLMTQMLWMRVIAVVGSLLEISFFLHFGGDLRASIFWGLVFITINSVHIVIILRNRFALAGFGKDMVYFASMVQGLEKEQITRLLKVGEWRSLEPGAVITTEKQPVDDLTLICEGHSTVTVGERTVARVGPGQFIGDISFTTGSTATASVVAAEPMRIFVFNQARLKALFAKEPDIGAAVYRVLGSALSAKVQNQNARA